MFILQVTRKVRGFIVVHTVTSVPRNDERLLGQSSGRMSRRIEAFSGDMRLPLCILGPKKNGLEFSWLQTAILVTENG